MNSKLEIYIKTSFKPFVERMTAYFCEDICCVIFSYIFDPVEYLKMITTYSNKENCIVRYDVKEYELVSKYIQNDKRFITFHNKPKKKRKSGSDNFVTWGCVSISPIERCENKKEFINSLN